MLLFYLPSFHFLIFLILNCHQEYIYFEIYPPLADVIDKVYKKNNKDLAVIWLKALLKRLNREKLLGINMVKPLNINDLFKECLKSSVVL